MISVIIPVYNGEQWLQECLDSVTGSSYTDLDILIIDDGSSDHSVEICRKRAETDHRIRVFEQNHAGVSNARNFGIEQAKGEYISFVDCDDTIAKDMYQKLMEAFDEQTALIQFGYVRERDGNVVERCLAGTYQDAEHPLREYLYPRKPAGVWSKIYRKAYIRRGFPTDIRVWEDLLFNVRYLCDVRDVGGMKCLNESLYHYRLNPQGVSKVDFSEKNMDVLKVFDEIFSLCSFDENMLHAAKVAYEEVLVKTFYKLRKSKAVPEGSRYRKILKQELKKYRAVYLKESKASWKMKLILIALLLLG